MAYAFRLAPQIKRDFGLADEGVLGCWMERVSGFLKSYPQKLVGNEL